MKIFLLFLSFCFLSICTTANAEDLSETNPIRKIVGHIENEFQLRTSGLWENHIEIEYRSLGTDAKVKMAYDSKNAKILKGYKNGGVINIAWLSDGDPDPKYWDLVKVEIHLKPKLIPKKSLNGEIYYAFEVPSINRPGEIYSVNCNHPTDLIMRRPGIGYEDLWSCISVNLL